jgi:hypothetical protein
MAHLGANANEALAHAAVEWVRARGPNRQS